MLAPLQQLGFIELQCLQILKPNTGDRLTLNFTNQWKNSKQKPIPEHVNIYLFGKMNACKQAFSTVSFKNSTPRSVSMLKICIEP